MPVKEEFKELLEQEGNSKDFEYKGYGCRIRRISPNHLGYLCGYVVIPVNHRLHGNSYDCIESLYDGDLPTHWGSRLAEMLMVNIG